MDSMKPLDKVVKEERDGGVEFNDFIFPPISLTEHGERRKIAPVKRDGGAEVRDARRREF